MVRSMQSHCPNRRRVSRASATSPNNSPADSKSRLSNEDKYKDAIHFTKIDVDELSDLSAELGIKTMPTLLLFKDGEKVDTLNAPRPDTLREFLDKGL